MATLSFEVVESAPEPYIETAEYRKVAAAIFDLKDGQGLRIAETVGQQAQQCIRAACIRHLGFYPAFRNIDGVTYAFKTSRTITPFQPQNMFPKDAVVDGLRDGRTYRSLATEHGVSWQRIEQIAVANGLGRRRMLRHAAGLEFLAPYLEKVEFSYCIVCKAQRDGASRAHRLCRECHETITVLATIKSRLRHWRKNGSKVNLANAICQIRKRNIQPGDLDLV